MAKQMPGSSCVKEKFQWKRATSDRKSPDLHNCRAKVSHFGAVDECPREQDTHFKRWGWLSCDTVLILWLTFFLPNEEAHECPNGFCCSGLAAVHNINFEKLPSGCLREELF